MRKEPSNRVAFFIHIFEPNIKHMAISSNDIKIRYVVDTSNLEGATRQWDKLGDEEKRALDELKKYNSESKNTGTSLGNIGQIAGKVGAALGGVFAVNQILEFGKAVIDTTVKFESFRKAIEFASGSAEKGAENFQYLTDLANRLGLDLAGTVEAYKNFAAASRLAGQSQQETNRQFEAVAKAAQVMGLSVEDTKGALGALGQMLSKGTVQAEELRGQLGERLVGSFSLAAKAMGVTTQELGKMLEGGKVLATDLLPKFATELENTFGKGNVQVSNLAASQNRFNSSIDSLVLAIGNKLNPFLKGAYDLAAGIATSITKAAGGAGAPKATEASIAARRVEAELAKAVFDLDQTNTVKITAYNMKQINQKLAVQKLIDLEAKKDKNLTEQGNARIAHDKIKLKNLEREYKILLEMEAIYTSMTAIVATTPPPPPPVPTGKGAKAAVKENKKSLEQIAKDNYQAEIKKAEMQRDIEKLQGQLDGKAKSYELETEAAHQEDVLKIMQKYLNKGIGLTKDDIEKQKLLFKKAQLDANNESQKEYQVELDAQKKADKEKLDQLAKTNEDLLKAEKERLQKEIDAREKAEKEKQDKINATFQLTETLLSGFSNMYQTSINNEIAALNKRYDAEIQLAGGNEQKIQEINNRRAEAEKELKQKAFKAEQAAAVAKVIFETAAIVAKWASNPVTAGLAALTLANQAAQIGFIMAQPVPEFAEGTKGKPFKGGKAMVGEKGIEKVVTASGKVYFTPPTATLVDLPSGSQVIPNHALSKQELFMASRMSGGSQASNPMYGKLDELGSILKSLPITQLNMDERGFEKYIRTERRTTKILNNRFRS